MSKIPDKPEDIFVELTEDYKKVFSDELVSLILYGSAASASYIKGKSDINVMLVVTGQGMNRLEASLSMVKKWKKKRVAVPLVMTKAFIESSLDCYPIEFLNMKNSHVLIYGEDVLDKLVFKSENLRLQIEKEIKGKLVLLREGYLESEGSSRQLRQLISRSLTAFISIFNALLFLKRGSVPRDRRETIKGLANLFTIDEKLFLTCIDIKEGVDKLSGNDVAGVFRKYLGEVENICSLVDAL